MNRARAWHFVTLCGLAGWVGIAAGCGEDDDNDTPSSSSAASTGTPAGSGGASASSGSGASGATGGSTGGGGGDGGTGGTVPTCTATATGPTRGSAITISPDDSTLAIANRDSGSVTMMNLDWADGTPILFATEVPLGGGEPWQVAIDGCGERAYVALRADQKIVELVDIAVDPKVSGASVSVGSEPTALALSPNNTRLYVANWVDGTVSVVDPLAMAVVDTIDLNLALVATGLLGASVSGTRPGLAHPRSIAITNDGDADDSDEKIYVTEYFAQRTAPESADGKNSDVNKQGLVYRINASDNAVSAIALPPIADTGFQDSSNTATGCFPNQLQSITINGGFAYVTSVCASPVGPLGVFQKGACAGNAQCTAAGSTCAPNGSCTLSCTTDAECGFGAPPGTCQADFSCAPIPTNFKTTTHPALHVIDTVADTEVASARTNLNKEFRDLYVANVVDDTPVRRMPLLANDIAFVPQTGEGYVSANGTDAVFRLVFDPASSALTEKGAGVGKEYINLAPSTITDALKHGQNPVGVTVANAHDYAFVSSDVSRVVTAIDLGTQKIAGTDADPRVLPSTGLPLTAPEQAKLRGKRFFNTGLGRWSFKGQGWGACQSCHVDGLTDNVTWYFARGPRQSISLDGSFASNDPDDQRIFNWTAFFDEIDDFENNTRGVSGGVGALVTAANNPPANADRININSAALFPPAGAGGLNGSTEEVTANVSVLEDWSDVREWVRSLRSPRGPSNLDAAKVTAGRTLFADTVIGSACHGCHGGAKWTISRRFYDPSGTTNEALLAKAWDAAALTAAGFPADLLPAVTLAQQNMRAPSPKNGNLDQLLCILRPVGTFGVSPAEVNVRELRANMTTPGQGNETDGKGYNPPSLLGLSVGAPYFHAGNARTLEELFDPMFSDHAAALNVNLTLQPAEIDNLVAFLLSIDEATVPFDIPTPAGAEGGNFCAAP